MSYKNNWYDENGSVYLIFTRKEVQALLNLSDKTVTKAFKQLSNCKLIYEKKQGSNKPNLIYVGKIKHNENFSKVTRRNYDSRVGKSSTLDTENLRLSNNYINKNNRGNATKQKKNFCNFDGRVYPEEIFNGLYANQF